MSYKIEFDKRVVPELADITFRYEGQSLSAVEKFQTSFTLAMEILSSGIIDYTTFRDEIRRAPVPDFPYLIYYSRQEETQTVFIHAILHTRRSDEFTQKRLSGE